MLSETDECWKLDGCELVNVRSHQATNYLLYVSRDKNYTDARMAVSIIKVWLKSYYSSVESVIFLHICKLWNIQSSISTDHLPVSKHHFIDIYMTAKIIMIV